jgi:hypothetical protein
MCSRRRTAGIFVGSVPISAGGRALREALDSRIDALDRRHIIEINDGARMITGRSAGTVG